MRARQAAAAAFVLGALLFLPQGTEPAFAAARSASSLSGTARDPLGRALAGVEVLVLREIVGAPPVAVTHTGSDGRFVVADLPRSVYRIAAIKDGYGTFLGRVSTVFRSTVDLVLQPLPGEDLADGHEWILRAPGRSLLRETGAVAVLAERAGRGGPTATASRVPAGLQGRVDHLVALGATLPGGGAGQARSLSQLQGGETRMSVGSQIGQRGNLELRGRRDSMDGTYVDDGQSWTARQQASGVVLDFSYDTSLDAQLDVRAFYDSRDGQLGGEATSLAGAARSMQRSWGYDASWSKQLDAASRLAVQMAYLDASLAAPWAGADEVGPPWSSRALGAHGTYEARLGSDHQVRVGMSARSSDLSLPFVMTGDEAVVLGVAGLPDVGWGLRLDAQDAWSLSGPLTLVYGLGIEHDVAGRQPGLVVGRAGGSWSGHDLRVDLAMTYHEEIGAAWGRRPLPGGGVGWEGSFEAPLPLGLTVTGEVLSTPSHDEGAVATTFDGRSDRPLFLSDGNAALEQRRLRLQRQQGKATTFVQVAQGRVVGVLTPLLPLDLLVQVLDDRRLDFLAATIGLRVAPWGTDVVAEYRRIEDMPALGGPLSEGSHEYVELRLAQDLLRIRGSSWRLLLAARSAAEDRAPASGPGGGAAVPVVAALERWLGAGVSVSF